MKKFEELESKKAEEIIQWAGEKFKNKVALASSFGLEDVVLIDIISKTSPSIKIFTIDTGRLHPETYNIMDKIKEKYNITMDVYYPDTTSIEKMISEYGFNLFYKSIELRHLCCNIRKVEPLNRALKDLDAWICGLRKQQAVTRTNIQKVEIDIAHNSIIKINPITDWSEQQVWEYIKKNNVPYNQLHDNGYPSIGCAPCTRAIKPGEDIRAGRWWWESPENKECGLHPIKSKI
ncbi:MAG: phosphoadenylyl-sulfate reductase [Candidatus Omnitrophica bacterium]|jgi:phosphoadenosine phosphosulfate reductase|nr:phosphoadenylyl-sulfate reductase [Candidatus Omnitrophota bacterium]